MMDQLIRLTAQDSALVDTSAVLGLQRSMGILRCQELVEETIYSITEKLSKLERAMRRDDYEVAKIQALILRGLTNRIGLVRMSIVSGDLSDVLTQGNEIASHAVAARLIRLGEESLFTLVQTGAEGI